MKSIRVIGPIGLLFILLLGISAGKLSYTIANGEPMQADTPAVELTEQESFTTIHIDADEDISLTLYRRPETRQSILEFYTLVTGSADISRLILRYADIHGVSASLAFSLAYAESRFVTTAVNRNASSIDRGLFQLNSRSFPELTEAQFFDPEINTEKGIAYLRYCLEVGKNPVTALAMYNAGRTRVTERGAPKMTLDYIARILDFQEDLEDRIETSLVRKETYLAKSGPKSGKQLSYVLDKSKTVK